MLEKITYAFAALGMTTVLVLTGFIIQDAIIDACKKLRGKK